MTVELSFFVQPEFADSDEWARVRRLARQLLNRLNRRDTLALIDAANRPGQSSAAVQAAFRPAADGLGFRSERTGLFPGTVAGLRPDYFLQLGSVGVLLEVERGKTTANNMDLLDFWKCHICDRASYLFLAVPKSLQHNAEMKPKREFEKVTQRLTPLFDGANRTNVRGTCLFGY